MTTKKLSVALLCLILLVSCQHLKIENTEVCAVAGIMAAGMNCGNTLSSETREMSLEETIRFLEPQDEVRDATGKVIVPAKGPALCQSLEDFNKNKTALEVACEMMGVQCSFEMKEAINKVSKNLSTLSKSKEASMVISNIPKYGETGKNVLVLQKALNKKGYKLAEDGIFLGKTKAAVSAEQKKNGLPGSGVIGPKTLDILGISVLSAVPTGEPTVTQDLSGKQDRRLHPDFRVMLESKVFPGGVIPECFFESDVQACYAYVMEKMAELGIWESGGNNKGELVGYIQGVTGKFTKGGNGDAWCLDYCQCGIALIEDFFQVESPVIGSAHCMTTLRAAEKVPGLVSEVCEIGTLALAKYGRTDNGHAMAVIDILSSSRMRTSEGNTSVTSMRDGDGSGIKSRNKINNGTLVTKGFVRLYPNNKIPA